MTNNIRKRAVLKKKRVLSSYLRLQKKGLYLRIFWAYCAQITPEASVRFSIYLSVIFLGIFFQTNV